MLVRLTRTHRVTAGWIVALAYLLCVLAPTMSYALPGEHALAPCLTDESHVPGMVHVHAGAPARHTHADGHVHEHSAAHSHANSGGDHRSMSMALNSRSLPDKVPRSADGQCCGLMCVTALPASLIDIVTPSVPTAACEAESYRKVTDKAPSRLYRPPIS